MDYSEYSLLTIPNIYMYSKFPIAKFKIETKDFPCEDFLDQLCTKDIPGQVSIYSD